MYFGYDKLREAPNPPEVNDAVALICYDPSYNSEETSNEYRFFKDIQRTIADHFATKDSSICQSLTISPILAPSPLISVSMGLSRN